MSSPNTPPAKADVTTLVKYLSNLRDALVETAMTLRDYQFELNSEERQEAMTLGTQLIERSQNENQGL